MADSSKRSNAGSSEIEFDSAQLTLDDWTDALRTIRDSHSHPEAQRVATSHRPSATELLETPGALLTRSHLRELGLERRAIDAVFRTLAVVFLPGYSRPMIRAEDFRELVEHSTYRDDRVRPCHA